MNQPSSDKPVSAQDMTDAMIPQKSYDIPEFLVHSRSKHMDWLGSVEKAMAQAQALAMQAYALAWIELFEEHPHLQLVDTFIAEDGYITLAEATGEDVSELEGDMEYINDKRDSSILPFIQGLVENDQLERETLEDAIEQAYNTQAAILDIPTWQEVSNKRKALLETCLLEQRTARACSAKPGGPRL